MDGHANLAAEMAPHPAAPRGWSGRQPRRRVDGQSSGSPPAQHALLMLQRLAGNQAVTAALDRGGRFVGWPTDRRGEPPRVQRAPATATSDRAPIETGEIADEQTLVRQWSAEAGSNENSLTDRVFIHRHPDQSGQALVPGTPAAAEWIEIRDTVVRPALAIPKPPTAGEPAAPGNPPTEASPGTPQDSVEPGLANDPLGAAWDAGIDLIGWAQETGGEMIDAVAGFLGIGREQIEAGQDQEPEKVVDVPLESADPAEVEAPAPVHQRGDTFKNQRDNQSKHVSGGASCSPTAFTMALIDLHGGDEEAVRAQTIKLITDRGGNTKYDQTEELVIELLQVVDWSAACAEKPEYFGSLGKGWAKWAQESYKNKSGAVVYYKDPNAQQYVASLYSATGGSAAETYNAVTKEAWAPVIKALAEGAFATAQGSFTGGHVVTIVGADDSGVTYNDPFGMWIKGSGYPLFPNGVAKVPKLNATDQAIFDRRASANARLVEAFNNGETGYPAWGERNFLSWPEVESIKLGLWISVLRGR